MSEKKAPILFRSIFLAIFLCFIVLAHCNSIQEEEKLVNIHKLNENNWTAVLEGEWMVEFYAPWCPACNALQPTWEEFSIVSSKLSIFVGQIDITVSPGLSGRFMVTALPTIFHIINGQFRQYRGSRNKNAFVEFIEDKKWESVEQLPSWKSPDSMQMSVIAYFFGLSQLVRSVHTRLLEDYGLPTWGSYFIFAIVTILVGVLIGLLVVFIIDYVYPPKLQAKKSLFKMDDEKDSGEDTDDEIEVQDELIDDQIIENTESGSQEENSTDASLTTKKRKARKAD